MQCACWEGLNSYRKRFTILGMGTGAPGDRTAMAAHGGHAAVDKGAAVAEERGQKHRVDACA